MNNLKNYSNLYPERSVADLKRLVPYAGKTFYEYNPKDSKEYRTIYMHFNVFNSKVTPMYSNYIIGVPPSHIDALQPRLLSAIMRFNSIPDAPFH